MKSVKLIKITYWVFVVAALVLAVDFAVSIMHFNAFFAAIESDTVSIDIQPIGTFNGFTNIVITGAGLLFVLRTLVVLRRGFLFDRQLGILFLILSSVSIVLITAFYIKAHLIAGILPALSMPILMLLISILYWVGANIERENSLTV